MLRLFVGLGLPPELKLRLSLLAAGLPGARWVDPGNFHVTLRFIGEVSETAAGDVDAGLARIKAKGFPLTLAGIDHWRAQTLFVAVERHPALEHLHAKVESALWRAGLPPQGGRFVPHVTLARLKGVKEPHLQRYLSERALFRADPIPITGFALVASYLTKSGAHYEDQAEYPLGAG
ncbi:MAG TPA: RNA 2',3'-cyclic phosphodiesterase [Stellaceae bacterium]|nr:RNA 2',3'-cyclic phosphodiesterase [Stellaceae bacterium]